MMVVFVFIISCYVLLKWKVGLLVVQVMIIFSVVMNVFRLLDYCVVVVVIWVKLCWIIGYFCWFFYLFGGLVV